MKFAQPQFLWLLALLVPALILFFLWAERARARLVRQFISDRLLGALLTGLSPRRRRWRQALIVLAAALLCVALARPQWGYEWEEAKQRGLDIVVALDTSKSMLAEDVKPNRLERAKLAAVDLARLAQTDRLALVPFAATAFLQCPLTIQADIFSENVRLLDVNTLPVPGTALPDAIETAMTVLKQGQEENEKALVIISDGENWEGDALAAAQKAAKAGMRIFTIGVGTTEGDLIPTRDTKGRVEFHRDADGNVVKTRLNETLLQQIASAGNGFYLPLRGANAMDTLYREGLAPMPKSDLSSRRFRRYHERYHWPLALAIALLLAEMFLPERSKTAARQSATHDNTAGSTRERLAA